MTALASVSPAGGRDPAILVGRVTPLAEGRFGLATDAGVFALAGDAPPCWSWVAVTGTWTGEDAALRIDTWLPLTPPPAASEPTLPEVVVARRPAALEAFRQRAALVSQFRRRLDGEGFVETVTPMLQGAAECGQVAQLTVRAGDRPYYLRTDPEEYLKRYLSAGLEAVYEVSTNVRADATSARHLVEFQSLEFYRRRMAFSQAIDLAEDLVAGAIGQFGGAVPARPFARVRFADLVARATGVDVLAPEAADADGLARAVRDVGLDLAVEPSLRSWRRAWLEALMDVHGLAAQAAPIWVTHYPRDLALSARLDPTDPRVSLRAELFFPGGLELAHVYENLVEGAALRDRYDERRRHRQAAGLPPVPLNTDLMRSADGWMPPMSGGAIGVDRLLMLARGDVEVGAGLLFGREVTL